MDDLERAYFRAYSTLGVHDLMLKDKVRTRSYQDAIMLNKHLFEGRIVLDIGCGTGILSMFAAKAGAARVIGVDNSDMAFYAQQIVADNGLDSVITIVHGIMEDIEELPHGIEKVDIIISEWMGYCLNFEWMMETVLDARDTWLKSNGLIFPDKCSLYVTAIEDEAYKQRRVDCWKNYQGFCMPALQQHALWEPQIRVIKPEQVVGTEYEIVEFDLNTVYKEQLVFQLPYTIEITRTSNVHALIAFFTVTFSCCHNPDLGFSTGPDHTPTHWMQTVFYLSSSIHAEKGKNIEGKFLMTKYKQIPRGLDVKITVNYSDQENMDCPPEEYRYVLA